MVDKVVKIDSDLLKKVEEFISLDGNKFRYVNRKQFIDIAVPDYLRSQKDMALVLSSPPIQILQRR